MRYKTQAARPSAISKTEDIDIFISGVILPVEILIEGKPGFRLHINAGTAPAPRTQKSQWTGNRRTARGRIPEGIHSCVALKHVSRHHSPALEHLTPNREACRAALQIAKRSTRVGGTRGILRRFEFDEGVPHLPPPNGLGVREDRAAGHCTQWVARDLAGCQISVGNGHPIAPCPFGHQQVSIGRVVE